MTEQTVSNGGQQMMCVYVCVCKIVGGNSRVFGVTVHELASFSAGSV